MAGRGAGGVSPADVALDAFEPEIHSPQGHAYGNGGDSTSATATGKKNRPARKASRWGPGRPADQDPGNPWAQGNENASGSGGDPPSAAATGGGGPEGSANKVKKAPRYGPGASRWAPAPGGDEEGRPPQIDAHHHDQQDSQNTLEQTPTSRKLSQLDEVLSPTKPQPPALHDLRAALVPQIAHPRRDYRTANKACCL
ncbi:hypothetical protein T484DRAFT_1752248 [Baffinella frigidus]|nr:hypothetical protein T484DRAFT_1752248 [Cryptophyta sp. CCMP2293]